MNLTLKQITKLGPNKLKPFSNSKLNTGQMIISALDRLEKIARNGENADYYPFSFTHSIFTRFFPWVFKSMDFVAKD